ncbi:MAG: hypothetical protein Q9157_006605 [Trypethelium eluteriae]
MGPWSSHFGESVKLHYRCYVTHNSLRDFNDETILLLANAVPSISARKGYLGREKAVAGFEKYFSSHSYDQASFLVQERCRLLQQYGIGLHDQARFEAVNGIAILANTIPTAFWTIYSAFRHPITLERLRGEAEKLVESSAMENSNGKFIHRVNISKLREVPFLVSHLQESIRHKSAGAGMRFDREDVMLETRFLLKKDTFLIMPNRSMHFDKAAWGSTVAEFRSDRFCDSSTKAHPAAFRGFGRGSHLCPGRFFAMTEILSMLVMMVLRFELRPVDGQWPSLRGNESNMSLAVAPPLSDVAVRIAARRDWAGGEWMLMV